MILPRTESQSASFKEDEKLCKKILDGDTAAFAVLAEKYRRRILSLGMGFFKNIDDAEDFLQEVAHIKGLGVPQYEIVGRDGPEHAPRFTVRLKVEGAADVLGHGHNKKLAEFDAAAKMLERISK